MIKRGVVMRSFSKSIIDNKMTRQQESKLALELLEDGFFWLDDIVVKVASIERNERHYFINYWFSMTNNNTRNVIVSQLVENKDE